jgi:hypothetical protein
VVHWVATFAEDGTVTLTPNTSETRREFIATMDHFLSGEASFSDVEVVGGEGFEPPTLPV